MMSSKVEIGRNETTIFFARFTVCGNSETVCSGEDVEPWQDEATQAAVSAAADVLLDRAGDYEISTWFADWHGGKFHRFAWVAYELYSAAIERDEEGEELTPEIEWCGKSDYPADMLAAVEAIQDEAIDAMSAELAAWVKRVAEDNARFAAEESED